MGKKGIISLTCHLTMFLVLAAACEPGLVSRMPSTSAPVATSPSEPPATVDSDETPDVIFHSGTVMTMEAGYPVFEAIAIRGDRIIAVGNDEEILDLAGADTQLIGLNGQTLLPGFADGHTHILAFPERMGYSLDEAQDVALRQGFTSLTEMWGDEAFIQELLNAEAGGHLRLRVNVFPLFNQGILDDGNKVIVRAWFPENDPILDSDRMLRIPGVKFFVDGAGVPGRGCPARSQPYDPSVTSQDWFQQICGSEYGDLYWSQEELNQAVAEVQGAGYRAAFHAMGDQAIETALNAIEFALDGQPNSQIRHQIQHSSLLRPDLLDRYVSMDIVASVRGYFNTCDQDEYSSDWAANRYALPGAGVHAYLETDFGWTADPDDPLALRISNPMIHLYGLVTHQQIHPGGVCLPAPWLAQHEITVEQALRMMTYEPVYAVSQEDVLGTLEAGKYADMIILSENPAFVDPNTLKDLEVWMTMVAGQVAYCAPGHEGFCPGIQPETEPTQVESEPVSIKLFAEEARVAPGTPVELTIGWQSNTQEQVADLLASMDLSGSLDGQPLLDLNESWGEILSVEGAYDDDEEDFVSYWVYPLGVLSPGTHVAEIRAVLNWPVTDGFDLDGNGVPDEYSGDLWDYTIRIIVEE